jgi:hypothetical protein
MLIEVKAIGLDLKDTHLKQAVDYAANQGVEGVVLTNASVWRIYRVIFGQPISHDLTYECDLLSMNPKNRARVEHLFLFAKEGQSKSVLDEFHAQRQQLTATCWVPRHKRPGARCDSPGVATCISGRAGTDRRTPSGTGRTGLKRELTEGEKADDARRRIAKAQGRALRARGKAVGGNGSESEVEAVNQNATPE